MAGKEITLVPVSNRDRLNKLLDMKRGYVKLPLVKLDTYRDLIMVEKELRTKIKIDEEPQKA